MLPRLFIDTMAWYAIADKGDNNHQLALIYHLVTSLIKINQRKKCN